MRNPGRPTTGSVTMDGVTATRTRKPFSPRSKRQAQQVEQAELGERALRMHYFEKVPQIDIARALGLSQPRVSQLIDKAWETRQAERTKLVDEARPIAIAECHYHARYWAVRAQKDPKAADVMLSWLTRADKIQGLYLERHELSVTSGRAANPNEPQPDYSLLTDDELATLDRLMQKACGIEPAPDPEPYMPCIADWSKPTPSPPPALITDASVVAVVEPETCLRDRILNLHAQGLSPTAIQETLCLSHAEFIAALKTHAPPNTTQ